MTEVSSEPSMEEILSSIKRIIAEDSDAALSPQRARRAAIPDTPPEMLHPEEVLELTEPAAETAEAAAPDPDTAPKAPPAPEAAPALVSPAAVEASRSSLAALSALVVKPEVIGSDTLEGLVREMLKPMLADWLDQRLPDVVERLVKQEIQRITDRG